jgi:uncharacterized protein involved in exopolysaccharide biosynthesis
MVEDTKISFIDIYVFIQKSWKTVLAFALLGLISAAIFLLLTPKQYEALAQIKMAQLSIPNNSNNSNDKTLGINIEEPRALILRMRLPTVYDQEAISSCGLIDKPNANQLLANKVKLTIPKEVSGVVDLKIREFSV